MPDLVHLHACRVLEGVTLADKLAPWPEVDVRSPHISAEIPLARPPGLALPTTRRTLPSIARVRLDQEEGRSRVLHELMNHELQAIELLAMALVRWPDAPPAFRRGLVATLRDEQRHCQLYIDRLLATGGEVGQQALSGFFWETLRKAQTPQQFVAGLSLCFEAANLDFCVAWKKRFAAAGDTQTADVLQAVYDDEVRHVAHGLVWFTRWTEGDRLDAWEDALIPPLTPARSRGKGFDRRGRAQAGFTVNEIERLRVVGGSRGRPPRVLSFDAAVEERVAGRQPSKMARAVTADLSSLPMFLLGEEDVVVATPPSTAFLNRLADAGFAIPRFVSRLESAQVGGHPVRRVERWGRVPDESAYPVKELAPEPPWDARWSALSSKVETAKRGILLAACGAPWVHQPGVIWTEMGEAGRQAWVLKRPFSTSGTGRIRGAGALDAAQERWVVRALQEGPLLWQPWYERLLDVSVHLSIGEGVEIDGFSRFLTSPTGSYRGAVLGPWSLDLSPEMKRTLYDASRGPSIVQTLESAALEAGRWAQSIGYRGPLSIDGAVVCEGGEVRVHPWLETNARRTLGRVALRLGRKVARGVRALWRVERYSAERAERLREASAVVGEGGIVGGCLPTNDPTQAQTLLSWIEVEGCPDAEVAASGRGDK